MQSETAAPLRPILCRKKMNNTAEDPLVLQLIEKGQLLLWDADYFQQHYATDQVKVLSFSRKSPTVQSISRKSSKMAEQGSQTAVGTRTTPQEISRSILMAFSSGSLALRLPYRSQWHFCLHPYYASYSHYLLSWDWLFLNDLLWFTTVFASRSIFCYRIPMFFGK